MKSSANRPNKKDHGKLLSHPRTWPEADLLSEYSDVANKVIRSFKEDCICMTALANHVPVKIDVQLNLLDPNASVIALGNNCPDDLSSAL